MACEFHVSGSESSCSLRLDLEPRPTNNRTSQLLALLRDLVLKRWEVLYAWQVYQEQQLQAYVAWVNSQLKKRAGCRMVEDLRRDMQDGVALVHLVEIVSGEALSRVDYDATSATVMRENVERVLQFMASKRIRMHHTSAKDIVDGNLKSIMRLILALAAHYKPSSVKQASQASPMGASPSTPGTPNSTPQRKSQRQPSFTAMAANAAAAIHDARKEAAGAGSGSLRRYKDMTPTHKQGSTNHHTMSPSPVHGNSHIGAHHTGMGSLYPTSTHQSYHHHHYPPTTTPTHDYQHRVLPRGESNDVPDGPLATGASSPLHPSAMVASPNTTSASASPMVNRMGSDRRRAMSPRQQMSLTHMSDSDQGSAGEDGGPHSLPSSRRSSISLSEALIEEQALMGDSIEDTKKLLQSLQELLLHGKIAEEDGSSEAEEDQIEFEGTTAKEQVVVLQARLNQQQYECNQLRNELSKVKQDCRNLQGTKAGLQSRLTEQDNAILQMKADSLKMGFTQQNLEAENSELKRNFEEKDRQASDISRQLGQKDKLLGQQQEQIESLTHQMLQLNSFKTQLQNRLEESGGSNMELESQIQELSHRLSTVGIAEANLAAHISAHDRKLGKLEGHLHNPDRPSSLGEGSEDMQTIRSTLRSLRSNISSHDPSHHLLDSLEQGIVSIMDQLQDSHYHNSRPISESSSTESAIRRYNQTRSSPSDDTLGDHKESLTSLDRLSPANNNLSQPCTKVLYFTERTVTPFMSSIPKRLGEVTLADFKQIFDREGAYRFHFKALDPEFGTVKEEVINDDDILPGWEGKIVGWVDEDTG
ncbi:dixin isoform X1 [Strongylocentrotus purpuratus]|uniref:Dixin n=1 Tax=Strongylocentrotus purpuratus TaxID=7668 RepID=A0A7M7NFH8_STRPU|nr:dixin isoform X1 [Strongylocentrotus purpuratus]